VKPIYRPSVIWAFVAPVSAACIVVFALCVSHYQKATMVETNVGASLEAGANCTMLGVHSLDRVKLMNGKYGRMSVDITGTSLYEVTDGGIKLSPETGINAWGPVSVGASNVEGAIELGLHNIYFPSYGSCKDHMLASAEPDIHLPNHHAVELRALYHHHAAAQDARLETAGRRRRRQPVQGRRGRARHKEG
jgi:hypothetical protein